MGLNNHLASAIIKICMSFYSVIVFFCCACCVGGGFWFKKCRKNSDENEIALWRAATHGWFYQ